ncbi:MAG: hypothetical protein GY856_37095 [bacterium]|nr:hypothetical protein [bacterium]
MNARLLRVEGLAADERCRMVELLERYFEGIAPERFAADLQEKNRVLLLEDDVGRLQGFSTFLFYRSVHDGEQLDVVYSGDTIVEPAAWGASLLAPAWIAAIRSLHREHGGRRLWWLLITSGYRTYRFLPVMWREFFPRHDRDTPPSAQRLMDRLATERFGSLYEPATGTVRFTAPQLLRRELRGIPASRLSNPHVSFFARVNPGHDRGDELVCLTEIADENLTPAGRRMVRRGADCRLDGGNGG